MGESLNNLVNQVLLSPQLRNCIENCLNTSSIPSSGANNVNSTQETTALPAAPTTPNVRNELRRLFPSVRASSSSCRPLDNTVNSRTNKRKKVFRENVTFMKEIILLKKPSDTRTLTGYKKAKSYEEGFALSAVEFEKSWSYANVRLKIAQAFQSKLNGIEFEILIPMSGYLVKPNLNDSVELDGTTLSKIYYNKPIYIRPLQLLRNQQKCEEELVPANDNLNLDNLQSNISDTVNFGSSGLDRSHNLLHFLNREPSAINEISIESTSLNETSVEPEHTSLNETSVEPEYTSLNDILSILSQIINEESTTLFNIYREDIWNCCIRALRRKSFSPYDKISVTFTDCDNKSEGAIDAGGPKREMFRLILTYLDVHSCLFVGDNNKKFITLNKDALEKRHYYEAGRLIALAIVHAGFGPRFFSELFFTLLSQGSEHINPTVDDVFDYEVKNEIKMAIDSEDIQSLRNVILEGSFIRLAGWEIMNDFEKKDIMVKDVIKFYVIERCKKSLDQFIEGLEILNVYNYIKKYPEYFIEIFCNTTTGILTYKKMENLFSIKYSEVGSNKRNTESRIVAFWKDYLLDCSENQTEDADICTLEEILIFATGINIIPPLGFPTEPALKFLHDDVCPYPKGNTCALELHLPTVHINYENFKKSLSFGIKNGMTFGYA